ncbi:MAG: hypothetical protein SFY68_02005 [Candidatus Sumerlaeia bacterium]|nr:hypothetical protein [Candidatus Sumerlaeia bacterium]
MSENLKNKPNSPTKSAANDDIGPPWLLRDVEGRTLMCNLHFLGGNQRAFSYAQLSQVEYDPSVGIKLRFYGEEVLIQGRNLSALHQAFLVERVESVFEGDSAQDIGRDHEPFIDGLRITPRRG